MCGRYVLPDDEALGEYWAISCRFLFQGIRIRYNVAPTCPVPILVQSASGGLEPKVARWGLVPRWWSRAKLPTGTFNARGEDAAEKPMWREGFRSMRCLMPARGWYEWAAFGTEARSGAGSKQPYFLHCARSPVIAFAGIWSVWERPGSEPVVSCAVLTKAAASAVAFLHDRMPVVVKPEHFETWVNRATRAGELSALMADAREDIEAYPVSPRVNQVRYDGPDLMEPVQA